MGVHRRATRADRLGGRPGVSIVFVIAASAVFVVMGLAGSVQPAHALTNAECITCHFTNAGHGPVQCVQSGCHGAIEQPPGYWPFFQPEHGEDLCQAFCHTTGWSHDHLAPHGSAALTAAHAVTNTCAACHGDTLDAMHPDCYATCHTSANPMVLAAIAAGSPDCSACHTSYHGGMAAAAFQTLFPGYLSWGAAEAYPGNAGSTSPHGGYTANTNKCAVCHSVHRAKTGGSVLTAFGPYQTYAQGCIACHGIGATFTSVHIVADVDGYISPHGTCTRCHALGPHGVGVSEYATLAAKLLNTNGDAFIGEDLNAPGNPNGLALAMFDGTGTGSQRALGLTLGTGYLCSACHQQSFAVNAAGVDPAGGGSYTGHRVTAAATSAWNGSTYGASYIGGPIAFANASNCQQCHDAKTVSDRPAFPHGYVDAMGATAPKTVSGSSYVWLTLGSDATAARTVLAKVVPETGDTNANLLTEDGLCLKCHRYGAISGVGVTY